MTRPPASEAPVTTSLKKRKQLVMDDFVSSVNFRIAFILPLSSLIVAYWLYQVEWSHASSECVCPWLGLCRKHKSMSNGMVFFPAFPCLNSMVRSCCWSMIPCLSTCKAGRSQGPKCTFSYRTANSHGFGLSKGFFKLHVNCSNWLELDSEFILLLLLVECLQLGICVAGTEEEMKSPSAHCDIILRRIQFILRYRL